MGLPQGANGQTADGTEPLKDFMEGRNSLAAPRVTHRRPAQPFPSSQRSIPGEPGGAVIVQNHITIHIQSPDFRELNTKLDELVSQLRRSNEIQAKSGII